MRMRFTLKLLGLAAGIAFAAASLAAQDSPRVELITGHFLGKTPAMREYAATHHDVPNAPFRVFPLRKPSSKPGGGPGGGGGGSTWNDKVLEISSPFSSNGSVKLGTSQFTGVGANGYIPPDTNISVGPTQIVETVNVEYQVYDKQGNPYSTKQPSPLPIHSIFAAAAGGNGGGSSMCASVDGGDPIVLYDKIDDKWIVSQLAYNSSLSNDHFCLAISANGDATGSYYAYDFSFGSNFPDYPKLGIWAPGTTKFGDDTSHAGVYFSANIFAHGNRFTGAAMCAISLGDVAKPGSTIGFRCLYNSSSVYSILPADMEGVPTLTGSSPAPSGTSEYYMQFSGSNTLTLFQFDPDFGGVSPKIVATYNIPGVATFHEACGGGACVPQEGTNEQLDSLGDRLMYRLSYRNYGSAHTPSQSMVVTQSVQNNSSSNQTGIRWYQLSNASGSTAASGWSVYQQGTYGPNDGVYRWMGSVAQDKGGNLAVGYSISGTGTYPQIAVAGQTPTDASSQPGNLETEQRVSPGAGSQTSYNRWGDYSSMSLDPYDDCTFWYATEFEPTTGNFNWSTEIFNFTISGCIQ
jgi:hypothetical protein